MADAYNDTLGVYGIPLNRMVTFRLQRLYAKLGAQAAKILKETAGLTPAQWRVLVIIDALGPVSSYQIVRSIIIDKGQLSRVLKGMVEQGLVALSHSESDQRSHVISMTEKGRTLFERARPAMTSRQREISNTLSNEEFDILIRAFDRLEAFASETSEEPA